MNTESVNSGGNTKTLRTWLPLLALSLMILLAVVPKLIDEGPANLWMFSAFGPFLMALAIILWWLIFSRARWQERLIGLLGISGILIVDQLLCHYSMRNEPFVTLTIPMVVGAFSLGTILLGNWLDQRRTWLSLALATIAMTFSLLVKTDGMWGDFNFSLSYRFKPSPEDNFLSNRLAQATSIAQPRAIDAAELQNPVWPKFRGPNQDGSYRGFVIDPDWKSYPPKEIWRIKVGPAWSSFIAAGKYLFTQEQRGEQEVVVAYDRENGSEVWSYSVQSRFFESLGGLGPRATPTLDQSSIYALGAEGWLVKLDATDGNQLWKVDLKAEAQRELPPMWGFSSSPLVSNGLIIVHAGGEGEYGVLAFRAEDGTLAWKTAAGSMSYGSVQEVTLLGRRLLAMLTEKGAHFWEPTTGEAVVDYEWPHAGYRALQPRIIDEDKLLIATGVGTGSRLVKFSEQDGKLLSADLWTATDLKPDFNDLLIHEGSIYGFDNRIFCCLDLSTGKKRWKGGRYEKGQALLLADSDLIIVISETGELVLLRTNPDKLEELAKLPALTGKTWNHPIVIDDRLYLRNASEAVCYQLPVKK